MAACKDVLLVEACVEEVGANAAVEPAMAKARTAEDFIVTVSCRQASK
jgi:hypothetical protein